jgi:hypothetical protein
MTRTRRDLLAAAGGSLAGVCTAGCLSDADPVSRTATATPTAEDGAVTLRGATVVPELVARSSPDSYGVYGDRDEQWLVAEVAADPAEHPPDSFAVDAGGERHTVATRVGEGDGRLPDFGAAYGEGPRPGVGWLAVELPNPLDVDAPRLTWSDGAYVLPGPAVERLAAPPAAFTVSFDADDGAGADETVTATVTVENAGTVDGTFVAALNRVGPRVDHAPAASVRVDVPVETTETWRFTHALDDPAATDGDDTIGLYLRWRDGATARRVSIEAA